MKKRLNNRTHTVNLATKNDINCDKSVIFSFSTIIELDPELAISNVQNKIEQDIFTTV